jgi:hypothetical protein
LEELDKILAHTGSSLQVHVLLFLPATATEDWTRSISSSAVANFPSTTVILDPDGKIAEMFGAVTSGDTHLFAPDGRLIFHGGITSSRGHVGDNAGSTAIMNLVGGNAAGIDETPVFGCAIRSTDANSNSASGKEVDQ